MEVYAMLKKVRLAFIVIKLENIHEYKLFFFYSLCKVERSVR